MAEDTGYCRTHGVRRSECKCPAPEGNRCPRCGCVGAHGYVHVRHGNGGGHNEPCPRSGEPI